MSQFDIVPAGTQIGTAQFTEDPSSGNHGDLLAGTISETIVGGLIVDADNVVELIAPGERFVNKYEVYEPENPLSGYGTALTVKSSCKSLMHNVDPVGPIGQRMNFVVLISGTLYESQDYSVTGWWEGGHNYNSTDSYYEHEWTDNPHTATDWVWDDLAFAKFGIRMFTFNSATMSLGEYKTNVDYTISSPPIDPQVIENMDEALMLFKAENAEIVATGTALITADPAEMKTTAQDVIIVFDETIIPNPAGMKIIAHDIQIEQHLEIDKVVGGIFVNVDNFIDFSIRTYAQFINQSVTIRDSYPQDVKKILGPLITFEFDFCTENALELGQNSVVYNLNYIIDAIGRTTLERDDLTYLVSKALNSRNPKIRDCGFIEYVGLDIIGQYKVINNGKRYYGNNLRLRFEINDYDRILV
jgi:hypothetical protein